MFLWMCNAFSSPASICIETAIQMDEEIWDSIDDMDELEHKRQHCVYSSQSIHSRAPYILQPYSCLVFVDAIFFHCASECRHRRRYNEVVIIAVVARKGKKGRHWIGERPAPSVYLFFMLPCSRLAPPVMRQLTSFFFLLCLLHTWQYVHFSHFPLHQWNVYA